MLMWRNAGRRALGVHSGAPLASAEGAWAGCLTRWPGPYRRTNGWKLTSGDYRTGEKGGAPRILFSWRIGRTPVCGGHAPAVRVSARMRARSLRSLYTQTCQNLFSAPSSFVQQAARGENFSRASMALPHASSTFGMSPEAKV